jgi:hypothetical protein
MAMKLVDIATLIVATGVLSAMLVKWMEWRKWDRQRKLIDRITMGEKS